MENAESWASAAFHKEMDLLLEYAGEMVLDIQSGIGNEAWIKYHALAPDFTFRAIHAIKALEARIKELEGE